MREGGSKRSTASTPSSASLSPTVSSQGDRWKRCEWLLPPGRRALRFGSAPRPSHELDRIESPSLGAEVTPSEEARLRDQHWYSGASLRGRPERTVVAVRPLVATCAGVLDVDEAGADRPLGGSLVVLVVAYILNELLRRV